jgi:biotin carboxylase
LGKRQRRLLFLGAHRYYVKSIEILRRYGYRVIAIDRNPSAPGFKAADEYAVIDIIDEKGVFAFAKKNGINGVLAVNDFGVRTAAFVSERLGLPGTTYKTANILTDKLLMRQAWKHNGLLTPDFFVAERYEDVVKNIESLNYPVIMKPADSRGGGSRGVKVVFKRSELKQAFLFAQSFYSDKRVLIEKCVRGSEHSVEIVAIKGKMHILAISDKIKTPYPYRVDRKVIYPAEISNRKIAILRDVISRAIQAVGFSDGAAHIELAFTPEGPVLFEIGGRCGGGASPQIAEACTGIPYMKIMAQIALGQRINSKELQPKFKRGAVYHFFIFPPGYVKSINGVKKMSRLKEVKDWEFFVKPPGYIREVRAGGERHGFCVILAKNREKALEASRYIDNHLKVQ